jgi:hypothetical protein
MRSTDKAKHSIHIDYYQDTKGLYWWQYRGKGNWQFVGPFDTLSNAQDHARKLTDNVLTANTPSSTDNAQY